MKIAVVGCGAVGSYYGGRLAQAGHEVHFLLRSDYAVVRDHGVRVRSPQGDFHVRPRCAARPEEIGPADLVLVALKTTANEGLGGLLPPLVSAGTMVMTLQNGLGSEEQIARWVDPANIMGGLCFVCINRLEPGVIHHLDHGLVVAGQYGRNPDARTRAVFETVRQVWTCQLTENLARARWEKLTWNVPFNGLGVAGCAGLEAWQSAEAPVRAVSPCLTTDQLLANPKWVGLVRELIGEVIAGANALGFDLPQSLGDVQLARTRTMGPYRASTIVDYERGQPLELEALFREPLRRAKAAGVSAPRFERLCAILEGLEAARSR